MAESGIILPVDSTGKATRTLTTTTTFTTGTGGVVHQQVVTPGDSAGNLMTQTTSGTKVALDVNLAGSAGGTASSSGALSAAEASSATGTTNTTAHIVCAVGNSGNATVTLVGGTYTALQLAFEASSDSGTTWFPIDATRSDGSGVDAGLTGTYTVASTKAWNIMLPGYTHVRVRVNAITSTVSPTVAIFPGPFLVDPSPTVAPVDGQKWTFVASVAAMSTTIASDVFVITGSATKTIRVTRVEVYCVAGAATTSTWSLIKRSSADTAGTTSAATTVALDSQTSATATATGYTVAPTLGTTVGPVRTWRGSVATTGTGVTWDFGGGRPSMCPVLRGTAQQLCVNNGTAIGTSGSWNICIEWTEE